jgi:glycosyltransferase involved in cell wall biosynthesis
MHEFAEEERSESIWRLLVSPAIRYLTKRYAAGAESGVDASITVCEPIAERYRRELGLHPIVVYNAPKREADLPQYPATTDARVRMVHHGYAKRGRGLERLVEALALTDQRFTLDFMLMPDDRGYIDDLKDLAERLAPGRVNFRDPVPPAQIVTTVAEYDLGLCVIEPRPYNNLMMLPNKFFEYIQAGLAVCVGPSPAMVELVQRYAVGVIAPTFDPEMVAKTLNCMTAEDLLAMRHFARRAAAELNADVEMGKIKALYQHLLQEQPHVKGTAVESRVTNGNR